MAATPARQPSPHPEQEVIVGTGGVRLQTRFWRGAAAPRAIVVVVHGYAEHLGRYNHVVNALVDRDFAVVGLDHRGHGQSDGRRAALGRGGSFDWYVADLHLVIARARAAFPRLPVFLLGHSMGGLIATRYALRHQQDLAGLILSGAAIQIGDDVSPLLKRLGATIAAIAPNLPVVPKRTGVLAGDPEVERRFRADPLCYNGGLRAGLGQAMQRAALDTQRQLDRLTLPLLVMHGADDELTNPAGSELVHARARSTDNTLRLWPGFRHEIFNEARADEVISVLLAWLAERTPT